MSRADPGALLTGAWLIAPTLTPHWLLILLSFAAVIVIARVAVRLFGSSGDSVTKHEYTQDRFWGVLWRWRYGQDGIWQVVSFCPNCDMQIYPSLEYGDMIYGKPDGSRFTCDHCGQFDEVVPIHLNQIENSVIRQVQRKLRTGEWCDTLVETQKQIRA